MMHQLILAACLVVSASAAKHCCSPDQWEGTLSIIMASVNADKSAHYTEGTINMAVDATTKTVATDENLVVDGKMVHRKTINDYTSGVTFTVQDGKCETHSLGAWVPYCIPDNATSDIGYYGLPGSQMNAQLFRVDYPNFQAFFSVTADTCVPIAEVILGDFEGTKVNENLVFVNVTPGIKDMAVFTAPPGCTSAGSGAIPAIGRRSLFV